MSFEVFQSRKRGVLGELLSIGQSGMSIGSDALRNLESQAGWTTPVDHLEIQIDREAQVVGLRLAIKPTDSTYKISTTTSGSRFVASKKFAKTLAPQGRYRLEKYAGWGKGLIFRY